MKKRIALILRKAANKLDPQTDKFYMAGVYYNGRHFVLTDPAITIYAYRQGGRGAKSK